MAIKSNSVFWGGFWHILKRLLEISASELSTVKDSNQLEEGTYEAKTKLEVLFKRIFRTNDKYLDSVYGKDTPSNNKGRGLILEPFSVVFKPGLFDLPIWNCKQCLSVFR